MSRQQWELTRKKPVAVVVDWYGPHDLETAQNVVRADGFAAGAYVAIGKAKG